MKLQVTKPTEKSISNIRRQYEFLAQRYGSYSAVLHLIAWIREQRDTYSVYSVPPHIALRSAILNLSKLYTERDLAVMQAGDAHTAKDALDSWTLIIEQYIARYLDRDV